MKHIYSINKYKIKTLLFVIICFALLGSACSSKSDLPFEIADSGLVLEPADDFLKKFDWDINSDFILIDESGTKTYKMVNRILLSGKESDGYLVLTEDGHVNFVRFLVKLDKPDAEKKYAYKLYDKLTEKYGKPDTSQYMGESLINHRNVSLGELYQDSFSLWDCWVMPPVMDDPSTLVSLHYVYDKESVDQPYLVYLTISRYSLSSIFKDRRTSD